MEELKILQAIIYMCVCVFLYEFAFSLSTSLFFYYYLLLFSILFTFYLLAFNLDTKKPKAASRRKLLKMGGAAKNGPSLVPLQIRKTFMKYIKRSAKTSPKLSPAKLPVKESYRITGMLSVL